MGSNAEHHSDETVGHQPEVPVLPRLSLLRCHLWRLRLIKLSPITKVVLGIRADGKSGTIDHDLGHKNSRSKWTEHRW